MQPEYGIRKLPELTLMKVIFFGIGLHNEWKIFFGKQTAQDP